MESPPLCESTEREREIVAESLPLSSLLGLVWVRSRARAREREREKKFVNEDYNEYSITLVTILPFHCDTNGVMIKGNFESLNASKKQAGSISIVALIFFFFNCFHTLSIWSAVSIWFAVDHKKKWFACLCPHNIPFLFLIKKNIPFFFLFFLCFSWAKRNPFEP